MPAGLDRKPAEISERVEENAVRAVTASSFAYGSLVGRLDLISSRGKRRIGLRIDHGSSVMCDVEGLEREQYMELFEKRVLAAGIIKRNLRGQVLSLVVDELLPAPTLEPLSARMLLGRLPELGGDGSAAQIIRRQRDDD